MSSNLSSCSTQEEEQINRMFDQVQLEDDLAKMLNSSNKEIQQQQFFVKKINTNQEERKPSISPNKQKKKRPLKMFTVDSNYLQEMQQKQKEQCEQYKTLQNPPKNQQQKQVQQDNNNNNNTITQSLLKLIFLPLFLTYLFLKSQNFSLTRLFRVPGKQLLSSIFLLLFFKKKTSSQQQQKKQHPPKKLELVLDLDETLIHSTRKRILPTQTSLLIKKAGGFQQTVYVQLRPHAIEFLEKLSQNYNISIYTASHKEYADEIINKILDPYNKGLISQRYYRDSCIFNNDYGVTKSLKKIGLKQNKCVFIDNNLQNLLEDIDFSFQIDTYKGESGDEVLFNYIHILEGILNQYDEKQQNLSKLIQKAKLKFL